MRLLVTAALAAAAAGFAIISNPFIAGVGYPCYRQPDLVVVSPTTLIIIAEARNNTYCSGTNDGTHSTVLSRTSTDGGYTWGPQVIIYGGMPDFMVGVYEPAVSVVHVFIQAGGGILYATSGDAGSTWSTPAPLSVPVPFKSLGPAVGHGLVLRGDLCSEATCGGATGRVIMPAICTHPTGGADDADEAPAAAPVGAGAGDVACPSCYSCLLWTADHGATWQLGAVSAQNGSREASLAQLYAPALGVTGQAVVYASERNMGNATGTRWHAVSNDGGASFSSFAFDPSLPDGDTKNWTGIVAGVSRLDTPDGTRRLVFTTPGTRVDRANLTVYASSDEATSWSKTGTLLWDGPSGYSDCSQINDTAVGVIFEYGTDQFAGQLGFGIIGVGDLPT